MVLFFPISFFLSLSIFSRSYAFQQSFNIRSIFKPQISKSNGIRIEEIKKSIKDISRNTGNGLRATAENKDSIKKLVRELETLNPTKKLTSSQNLNGIWDLVYTTNEGSSAGKLGPFIGLVVQDIKVDEKFYTNYVRIGSGSLEGALTATWLSLDDLRWKVIFKDITFKLFGVQLLQKSLAGNEGIWRMTFLDENFRILYALGGKNSIKENVYILSKSK
jgi:hypothetical protein